MIWQNMLLSERNWISGLLDVLRGGGAEGRVLFGNQNAQARWGWGYLGKVCFQHLQALCTLMHTSHSGPLGCFLTWTAISEDEIRFGWGDGTALLKEKRMAWARFGGRESRP